MRFRLRANCFSSHHPYSTPPLTTNLSARRKHLKNQIVLTRGVTRMTSHPAGNVSGWTLVEFLAMPPQSEVSILYHGPHDTQGFLELRKL